MIKIISRLQRLSHELVSVGTKYKLMQETANENAAGVRQ